MKKESWERLYIALGILKREKTWKMEIGKTTDIQYLLNIVLMLCVEEVSIGSWGLEQSDWFNNGGDRDLLWFDFGVTTLGDLIWYHWNC